MSGLQFSAPETLIEATELLKQETDASVLAGGTDLMVQMQSGMRNTTHVVDVKRIPELTTVVHNSDGSWCIGAAVCSAELNENRELKSDWPGVLEAADLIGSMQIQSRATMAGNLCNASPAADSVPALVAASATVTLASTEGRRTVPVESIPTGPGRNSLMPGELIVSINLPPKMPASGEAYLRFIPRSEMDIAVVGVGVFVALDDSGIVKSTRIALGAVAPTVLVFNEADGLLVGTRADDSALEAAASGLQSACRPIDDKRGTAEYRVDVAGVLFKRAAKIALERASR